MRLALERSGQSWDGHPLNEWPDAIVNQGDRPKFLYDSQHGGLRIYELYADPRPADQPWRSEPPSVLMESYLSDEVMELNVYAENGELLNSEVIAR